MAVQTRYCNSITIEDVGGANWTNATPERLGADDGSYATISATTNDFGDVLQMSDWGFSIPLDATVNFIRVDYRMFQSSASNGFTPSFCAFEISGQVAEPMGDYDTQLATSEKLYSFQGDFGQTLTPSAINSSATYLYTTLIRSGTGGTVTASVDTISVTVDYTPVGGETPMLSSRKTLTGAGR